MTLEGMKKFINALEAAGVKNWEGITDVNTHLYNNDSAVNVLDESDETMYNFGAATGNSSPYQPGSIVIKAANFGDIHEVRFGATFEETKKFIDAFGLALDKDQMKILIKIYGNNYKIKPETGDYLNFVKLNEEQIANLSPEEKADYDKALAEYKKSKRMSSPVQVTV